MSYSPSHVASHTRPAAGISAVRIVLGLLLAALAAVVLNTAVAVIAHAAGAAAAFQPLQLGSFAPLTVVGVLVGAAGWAAVRHFSRAPGRVLRWLVPTVVVLSWLPDLALLAGDPSGSPAMTGVSGLAVAALMVMHVTTAVPAVAAFSRVLPVRPSGIGATVGHHR